MTDPIADMLTRIRNSAAARQAEAVMPFSKAKFTVAKILEKSGYVGETHFDETARTLNIKMRYSGKKAAFENIRRVSKPGRRVYVKSGDIKAVRSGNGISIISTSQGMMTNVEARDRKLGGEIICEIY